nr:MAG TPA: hypothetical protein [Caudoviricetes sp.]
MKRIGYLHEQVCKPANIELADRKARRHKSVRWGILKHDKHRESENAKLVAKLQDLTYKTSKYSTFKIYEPKERLIFRPPYYPDRITHHAIMNITEPIWTNIFIKQTYSCIKDRGIHNVATDLKRALTEHPDETTYCLKMDVRKFYPSINHDILYTLLQKKIKDPKLLKLLKEIIESAEGVPIGNYLSQFFANLYLAYFDHWAKEELKCKFYFRYADDIVILSNDKAFLRNVLVSIKLYLKEVLKLTLKPNYQVFPVESRGIDFVGYRFYHTHILLRKSIKIRLFKLINKYKKKKITKQELRRRLQSYFGWLKFCNSKNLLHKIQLETGIRFSNWSGKHTNISRFYNKYIHVVDIINYNKCFRVNFVYNNRPYYFESKNKQLFYSLHRYSLPVNFKITPYVRTKKNRNKRRAEGD